MKKFLTAALFAAALTACQKEPDLSELNNNLLVYTNVAPQTDFSSYSTFYIPDSILLIGASSEPDTEPVYWDDAQALQIIDEYVDNLSQRGYVRTHDKAVADLGVQVSYVECTRYFTSYPYWWETYPYWWDPTWWGGWAGWYYPYSVVYSYSTGSLLGQILDLTVPQGANADLTVIWNSFMTGLLSGDLSLDMARALDAVDQSFIQSPYLEK